MPRQTIKKSAIVNLIFGFLAAGVFLHGGISVFFPDVFRWWKELILVVLCGFALTQKPAGGWQKLLPIGAFGCVCGVAVLFSPEVFRALTAARYLALFPLVLGLVWWLRPDTKHIQNGLIIGAVASTIFGLWGHFLGGYEVLQSWYSTTISSWVPGQAIPLYHEINGLPRLQGLSSGPVAYGHLALLGLWAALQKTEKWKWLVSVLLLFGIWLSASRGALGGAVIVLAWHFLQALSTEKQWKAGGILGVGGIGFLLFFGKKLLARAGTSDHFSRPIEVLQQWFEGNWWLGEIGEYGPAARAYNLSTVGSDVAPIAENVFIDVLAQTGIIGFGCFVWLFWVLFQHTQYRHWGLFVTVLATVQLATLFDMAPVAICFGLALGASSVHNAPR